MKFFSDQARNGLLLAGLAGLSALSAAGDDRTCNLPAQIYGAEYRISTTVQGGAEKTQPQTETLRLLRSASRVMHIHPQSRTADMWELNARGTVHFSRFYDAEQRGIEFYQAAAEPASQFDWEQVWQLAPEAVRTDNPPQRIEQQSGCARVENYHYEKDGLEYELDWLSEQQLVLAMVMTRDGQRVSWALERVVEQADTLPREYQRRAAYITIDFADLGDQESDPFFRSMKHSHGTGHP